MGRGRRWCVSTGRGIEAHMLEFQCGWGVGYTQTVHATINYTHTHTENWEVSKVAARSTSDNGAILNFWVEYPALHRSFYLPMLLHLHFALEIGRRGRKEGLLSSG